MTEDADHLDERAQAAVEAIPISELAWAIEAMLFASGRPQTVPALARAAGVGPAAVRTALDQLAGDYEARGLRLVKDGAGLFEIAHAPEYAACVERLLGAAPSQRLSRAALETLAIIAWRQPCTRAQVEAIRGVNSDKLIVTLEGRGFLEVTGRAETPGRPRLYRTTLQFFEHFGLEGPEDLPPLLEADPPESVDV
ncbi:MAG: SMC-Scp complex subunit ScpB [Dehalococcoidia bacterium]